MSFAKSAAITLFSNLFLFLVSILTTIITSRLLGTEGRGILGVANNLMTFATLSLGLGMASSSVFYIGRNRDKLNGIFGNNLVVALVGIIVLIPFYFINVFYHFPFLKGLDNTLLILVLVAVPVINFKAALVNVLLGLQEIVEYNRLNIIDRLINLALLVGFIIFARSPVAVLLATLIGAILVAILEVYVLVVRMGCKILPDFSLMGGMLKYGIKALIGNVIQWLNYRLDIFIINYFLPLSQVGIYTTAVPLGETLWQVSGSIATLIFPLASASTDRQKSSFFTNQVTRICFAFILLFSIILGLISKPLIIILFGEAFVGAAGALLWLLPGISIFSVSNILANYLAGHGQLGKNIFSSIISCFATVVMCFYLVPRLGINGASMATSISYIIFTVSTLIFYCRYTQSRWQDILLLKKSDVKLIHATVRGKLSKLRANKGVA